MTTPASDPSLGPEGQFWAYLREGRLMIQRSRSDGAEIALAHGNGCTFSHEFTAVLGTAATL
jgi:hypothetical protein